MKTEHCGRILHSQTASKILRMVFRCNWNNVQSFVYYHLRFLNLSRMFIFGHPPNWEMSWNTPTVRGSSLCPASFLVCVCCVCSLCMHEDMFTHTCACWTRWKWSHGPINFPDNTVMEIHNSCVPWRLYGPLYRSQTTRAVRIIPRVTLTRISDYLLVVPHFVWPENTRSWDSLRFIIFLGLFS